MILHLEELSLNAWPALQTTVFDGWVLRFSEGYTKRANSVNPLYESTLPLEDKIAFCEQVYTQKVGRTVFKMTSASQPAELDAALADQGYVLTAPTSVQTLPLSGDAFSIDEAVSFESYLTGTWLDAFCHLNSVRACDVPVMTPMLESIIPPHCFMSLTVGDEVAAVGLAVAERGFVGLFDIVTGEQFRRQGLGRRLVQSLLKWGQHQGADRAYLQVVKANTPALGLYAGMGFTEVYDYWYRVFG